MPNFLDLPLEIREQIYTHLLVHPPGCPDASATQDLLPRPPQGPPSPPSPALHPAILAVSRQTYAEAHPILYTQNTFQCHHALLTSFPRLHAPQPAPPRPRRQWPQISDAACPGVLLARRWHLRARLDCGPFWGAEAAARALSGAEELTVEARQSAFGACGNDVLRNLEGVRGVRRARVCGSTTGLEGYVRWLEGVMMSPVGTEVVPYVEAGEAPGDGRGSDREGDS